MARRMKGKGGAMSSAQGQMNIGLKVGMVFLFTAIGVLLLASFFPPATQLTMSALDKMQNDGICEDYHNGVFNTTTEKCYTDATQVTEVTGYYGMPLTDIISPDNGFVALIIVALVIGLIVALLFAGFSYVKHK